MNFTQFDFHPKIIAGIQACRYEKPTPIQEQAIPAILGGRDIMGLAQTGTGKTAAFVLPVLQQLLTGPRGMIRTLIVAPTRELAEQIHSDITMLAGRTGLRSVAIYGGVGKIPQIKKIKSGAEIVVACPGRLLDHLREGAFNLKKVEHLILDEADHMFDMGFLPDIRRILKHLPAQRQTLLFSATMPAEIRHLAEEILDNPVRVQIAHTRPTATVTQVLFNVEQDRKTALLKQIMSRTDMSATLIFTRTKYRAASLARQLEKAGHAATSLQGNLSQNKRRKALDGFRRGEYKILVATDIAARGIDVSGISHVINFDVPDTVEAFTHRIGRTGRAACTGQAFTFAGRADGKIINRIERALGGKMTRADSGKYLTGNADTPVPTEKRNIPHRDEDGGRQVSRGKRAGTSRGYPKKKTASGKRPVGNGKKHNRAKMPARGSGNMFLNP
ncbi:MAG: DEAD/DEAH box helicase [Desulfobulbaceae bacterium]